MQQNEFFSIDVAQEDGDKTVVARAKIDKKGKTYIFFDEFAEMPNYKWWKNPIKWYKWRKLWKVVEKDSKKWMNFKIS